jgi:hypothetical protein
MPRQKWTLFEVFTSAEVKQMRSEGVPWKEIEKQAKRKRRATRRQERVAMRKTWADRELWGALPLGEREAAYVRGDDAD